MAKITSKPVRFKAPVSVGDDEYTAHLNQAEFVSTAPTSSWTDLDGKVYPFGGESAWQLTWAGAQDWETVNSLSLFLYEHDGETVEVSIDLPGGKTATADVIVAATNIGGTINSPMAFSKTMPSSKPVLTDTTP